MRIRRISTLVFFVFAAAAVAALSAGEKKGPSELFVKKCAKCHGEDGRAETPKGKKMKAQDFTEQAFQQLTTDAQIVDAITNGTEKDMPSFGKVLSPDEIQSLLKDVRNFAR